MRVLHLDFETRSDLDLRKVGLHVYARGQDTGIWCMAYAFDDEPVKLWFPNGANDFPYDVHEHVFNLGEVWAHNAAFEFEIWNAIVGPHVGAFLKIEQMVCTMAMSYAMGLPGSLDGSAAALGIKQRKDLAGSRLMLQMCQPRRIESDGTLVWWDEPEKLNRLGQYCVQDVVVERELGKRLLRLSPYEREVWRLDQKINARGIMVDVKNAERALELVESEKDRLNAEIRKVSGNQIATCTAVQQIKTFLKEESFVDVESLAKADVVELLDSPVRLSPTARRVLELRQEAGLASTAKLKPMILGAGSDGRLRGCFQYSGAHTRRWAGRRVQLHNLKRPTIPQKSIELAMRILGTSAMPAIDIDCFIGRPMSVVSECIRSFLIAAPGHDLLACDFSAIEARVLPWLAGQEETLETFRRGDDIYVAQAANIFGKKQALIDSKERQIGKVAVLALGYQGGAGSLGTMAKAYGVKFEPAFDSLLAIASDEQVKSAHSRWEDVGEKYEISENEFIARELTKIFWRQANQTIVQFWYDVENAAIEAVLEPGRKIKCRNLVFLVNGSFLWLRLPSGGVLCYPYPELKDIKTPWGATKKSFSYMAEDGKTWARHHAYGGSLVENITQAVARDILADAMLRLEKQGYPIVAHVHDEIICEMVEEKGSVKEMAELMSVVPEWAFGLPLKAEGWRGKRYRK